MTLPPVIRVFFAIDLPLSIKESLSEYIILLKKKSRTHGIRWTKPVNLHITLQFLAEAHSERLNTLIHHVRSRIEGVKQSDFRFGTPHLFPNPYRPRVIVLEIMPQDELAALSERIGMGMQDSQYDIEKRSFRAHLTLGRIKQPKEVNLSFLSGVSAPDIEKITVQEVVLFRSEPKPEGSEYTVIERLPL